MPRSPCISPWPSPCRRPRVSGASGACIVHNDKTKAAEAFVFPPIAAQGTVGGQPFIVPSGVRAITLMHVRHGSAALGGDGGAGRTAGAFRRAGIACSVARSAVGRRDAGWRPRGAAHFRRRCDGRRHHAHPARARRHPGRDPPARRRRLLPGPDRRARCPSRSRRWAAACRWKRCVPRSRRRARRPPRATACAASLCRAGAGCWRLGTGRLEGPGAEWTDACRFRRLRGPRCRRRQGGRGGL